MKIKNHKLFSKNLLQTQNKCDIVLSVIDEAFRRELEMRTEIKVTMKNIYKYEKPGYGYYASPVEAYIYTMTGEDGKTYIWKTTSVLFEKVECKKGQGYEYDSKTDKWYAHKDINRGDVIRIKATIKGESEYKGQPQTEVQRVVLVDRLVEAETKEQYIERKAEEQEQSLKDGDFIWEMPYRQYKSHYSDCETVRGSFRRTERGESLIKVIIRDGRLKASGVRGEHFKGYVFYFTYSDQYISAGYKAVCEENARKRLMADYPDAKNIKVEVYY